MNQVWIVLWIVLICERRSATQKSKKHDPAIAHILAFCLLYFRAKKTNHGLLTLLQQGISFLGARACWLQWLYYPAQQKENELREFKDRSSKLVLRQWTLFLMTSKMKTLGRA
jgi:hypothetical protein